MGWLVGGNIVFLLIAGGLFYSMWREFSRSMFFNTGVFYLYFGTMVPVGIGAGNIVLLAIVSPEHVLWSTLPLVIPAGFLLKQAADNVRGRNAHGKFTKYKEVLLHECRLLGVPVEVNDLRIRLKNGKNMEYLLTVKEEKDVDKIRAHQDRLLNGVKAHFPDYQCELTIVPIRKPMKTTEASNDREVNK